MSLGSFPGKQTFISILYASGNYLYEEGAFSGFFGGGGGVFVFVFCLIRVQAPTVKVLDKVFIKAT